MPTLHTPAGTLAYFDSAPGSADKPIALLLHCSAGASLQWRKLIAEIATRYRVVAPDLIGYGATPMTLRAPTMADEVAMIAALAAVLPGPFHLVGHSFGGAVALEAALTIGSRIASLALYEPASFHLLRTHGRDAAWAEISALAARHIGLVETGENQACAKAFMTYWMGPGAYASMPAELKGYVASTVPKIAAEWRMVFESDGTAEAYAGFDFPALVMSGERSTLAARTVAEIFRDSLPGVSWQSLPGIGHMGPVTHAGPVNASLVAFLDKAQRGHSRPAVMPANDIEPPRAAAAARRR